MDLIITTEHRFVKSEDNRYYAETGGDYMFWSRYLNSFDRVKVVGRVRREIKVPINYKLAEGENVSILELPYYKGLAQYVSNYSRIIKCLKSYLPSHESVILRLPGQISTCFASLLADYPYAVEVVGDPFDVLAPGAIKHPLRPMLRWLMTRAMKRQCFHAIGAAYVTEYTLQRRYPCPSFSSGISDVLIPFIDKGSEPSNADTVVQPPAENRSFNCTKLKHRIITVASLSQLYKAPDVMIDAVAICIEKGYPIVFTIVGDGKYREELQHRVLSRNIADFVVFTGQIPSGESVWELLDGSDLFLLPSRTEGLPRALIEAMARGLPCIGSTVGGIPELLSPEDMVPPNNVIALSDKIIEVLTDGELMNSMSLRNKEKAMKYSESLLLKKRTDFFAQVINKTLEYLSRER